MTGAEALSRLEERGARVVLLPDEKIDITAPAGPETDHLIDELAAHKPEAVAVLRERERPVRFPDEAERLRHRPARRDRTLRDLAGRYCSSCGFSAWAVTGRGDASCYGCRLLARGITPTCGRCKRQEWRPENGRRVCRYCEAARLADGDMRKAAPSASER